MYMVMPVAYYLLCANVLAFIAFGVDKRKARKHKWRTSERTLLLLAVMGGSVGAWLGMEIFRHKTKHKKFRIGIPVIFFLQLFLFLWAAVRLSQAPMLI